MTKRRIAVIGLGMAATPHMQSLKELSDRVEIVCAMGRSQASIQAFSKQYSIPTTDQLLDILQDKTITAVSILTPPNTHLELVSQIAATGKHILLEKPLEISLARSLELVERCRKANVKLGVVLQHRLRPTAVKFKELLTNGVIGNIVGASAIVPWWRAQTYYDEPGRGTYARDGGGVLITQAIHVLDLFIHLAGEIAEVFSYNKTTSLHRMEAEDIVGAAVKFKNGAIGTISATTACYPGFAERIEIIGDRATALWIAGRLEIFYHDGRQEKFGEEKITGGGSNPMDYDYDMHKVLITDFLDALDKGGYPQVSGESALRVHRLIDGLAQSSREDRSIELLP